MVAYTKPQQRKKEESEQLRGSWTPTINHSCNDQRAYDR